MNNKADNDGKGGGGDYRNFSIQTKLFKRLNKYSQ